MAITPRERLLDLTRLVSRAGRPMTGVDRVEFAYLTHLFQHGPLWGLVRSSLGYVLLDTRGCVALRDRIAAQNWGAPDRLSRIKRGLDPIRMRAESDLRRLCVARCLPLRLGAMLRRHLPRGLTYVNTGHTNLTDRVLSALQGIDAPVTVFIHDTIPLDVPQYQRPGTVDRFRHFLNRAARADLLVCNSHQTETDLARHLPAERLPQTISAPLGLDLRTPTQAPDGPWQAPYFVTLGTIEPRKNHALLLDLWEEIPEAHLLICGSRGWENHAVFARLDARPPRVHELPGLDDGQVAALLQGSAGMLFPSFAEGYGLPPVEAAALGVPLLLNNLPIYWEVLGDIPVYADVADKYLWRKEISRMAADHQAGRTRAEQAPRFAPPTWAAHFKTVLTLT
ncbi:glycosyltransferase family 4 protein [Mameliella sp. CS4]|uniref:glycosyltransferase family 4 protein n=1 Tax=Mameliella sp. CS4 TaxID=2862329 RepID=UPI001C604E57|nr:glycosyltransferase family 1 protein [Mameliella sp. CS4]MBW4981090.1 glycosyltransferase family 4 protein [Mameliella sp. CS4]